MVRAVRERGHAMTYQGDKLPREIGEGEAPPERYCKPFNAGGQSTPEAVARRLGRLFDALSDEITSNVVRGDIVEDIRRFRFDLLERLESEGWFGTYDGGNRFKVYPPGSPTGARKQAEAARRLRGES